MNGILSVEGLSLSVPTGHVVQGRKQVLHDVCFSVARGSATAYLGPNGAGKTSTFRILCGLSRADAGSVRFAGEIVSDARVRGGLPARRFGFMPEQPYFYRNLTPRELLGGLGRLSGMSGRALTTAIQDWAGRLDFETVLDQPLRACSKGQVQRVGLAQALLHEPEFVLLDEPLSGLDPLGRERVRQVLHEVHAGGGTLLFSSHILSDAESMCDAVVVLDGGRVVHQGDIAGMLGKSERWAIVVEGDAGDLPAAKRVELGHGRSRLLVDGEAERDRLLNALRSSFGCRLLSVEQDRQTLEQAFISLLQDGRTL